jgi:hypothetical protein
MTTVICELEVPASSLAGGLAGGSGIVAVSRELVATLLKLPAPAALLALILSLIGSPWTKLTGLAVLEAQNWLMGKVQPGFSRTAVSLPTQ